MSKIRVKWIFVCILGSVIIAGFMRLNYTGYCYKEKRYLSDDELIQAAIRHNLSEMNIDSSEESIRNFHKSHPSCCAVDRDSHMASSWIEKLMGLYYVEVELNYELKKDRNFVPPERASKHFNFYTQYMYVNACGNGAAKYGEESEILKDVTKL